MWVNVSLHRVSSEIKLITVGTRPKCAFIHKFGCDTPEL